jgi:hypothetical protein
MFVLTRGAELRLLLDEAGEGMGGGGGEAPKFTQSQFEAAIRDRLGKSKAEASAKIAELESRLTGFDELKSEFEKAKEEREMAGKSAIEKLEHKHAKDLGLLQRQIEEYRKGVEERDGLVKQSQAALFNERLSTRISGELGKIKVLPQYLEKAVRLAKMDLADVVIDEAGKVTASYGDHVQKPIGEVLAAWAKDNDNFLPAASGGAGTRAPNGGGAMPTNLWDLETNELLVLDAKRSRRP